MIDFITGIKYSTKMMSYWAKFLTELVMIMPYLILDVYVRIIRTIYRFFVTKREESLLNEVIVLVGAGKSEFGIQLAMQLAETNAKIVLVDKPPFDSSYDPLIRKIKENGEMAFFYECDIADKHSVRNTVEAIEKDVGPITMLFYGNLMINMNNKDLTSTYVNLTDAIFPRMQAANKGHMVFLSLINGNSDYIHHHFVQGHFDSLLAETRALRARGAKISMTQVNVHKKLLAEHPKNPPKFGIFGTAEVNSLAKKIIKDVRKKKLLVTIPSYMSHVPIYLRLLPRRTADAIIDLMYCVY